MKHTRGGLNQAGVASIMFTMVMMVVISLIVLAFAQVARRGQREVLDNQLNTQAYYAAETGANDIIHKIEQLRSDPSVNMAAIDLSNADCTLGTGDVYTGMPSPSLNSSTSYTCANVNPTPGSIEIDTISSDTSRVAVFHTATAAGTLTFKWSTDATSPVTTGCPTSNAVTNSGNQGSNNPLPSYENWKNCSYGLLRFDLVELPGSLSRTSLAQSTMAAFAVPSRGGSGNVSFTAAKAVTVPVTCTGGWCTANVSVGGSKDFAVRMTAQYTAIPKVLISASGSTHFVNSQAVIDVTGKAQDVLRRMQIRVPLDISAGGIPNDALSAGTSVCKRFGIGSNGFLLDAGAGDDCPIVPGD